ncbi:NUDIX domain-containing protein [Novosphingobium panipatense]|uniref:NUDIX domain-containing protein n=1 Tax=Novosphingobium panipatense TaxID=428991 RepID=UPI0039A1B27E
MAEARIASKTLVYDGWYKLYRMAVDMPDGSHVERHMIDNGSSVAVLPYDPVRRTCLLVSQPRVPVQEAQEPALLEAIAGNLDGNAPEEQIRKEALEEAGLQLSELEPVSNIWSWAPVSTERIQLYIARYGEADRVGYGGGDDENECILVHEISLDGPVGPKLRFWPC